MGFSNGAFATIWEVKPGISTSQRCRLSISRKDKTSGEYVQDFSGYCDFWGQAAAKAQKLKPKDRIKLLNTDVSSRYDKDAGKEYVNFKVFDFENAEAGTPQNGAKPAKSAAAALEGDVPEEELPF